MTKSKLTFLLISENCIHMFHFEPSDSWHWATSQWQKDPNKLSIPYVIYKAIMTFAAFGLMFYTMAIEDKYLLKRECYIFWHFLWTNGTSHAIALIQFMISLIVLMKTFLSGKVPKSGFSYYLFQLASLDFTLTGTIEFWTVCHRLLDESRLGLYLLKCGAICLITYADLMIGASEIKIKHIWITLIFGLCFCSWEMAMKYRLGLKKCIGLDGTVGVFPMEGLGQNRAALIYNLLFIIILIISHTIAWSFSRLRRELYNLRPPKQSVIENVTENQYNSNSSTDTDVPGSVAPDEENTIETVPES